MIVSLLLLLYHLRMVTLRKNLKEDCNYKERTGSSIAVSLGRGGVMSRQYNNRNKIEILIYFF